MPENASLFAERHPARIEPDERLVVLARTMHAQGSGSETAWRNAATDGVSFGEIYPIIPLTKGWRFSYDD